MPKIKYQDFNFNAARLEMIGHVNRIITEYSRKGFDLTLRQVYYQCVSRGLILNKNSEYKRLGNLINDARMAGLIDWYAIVDRTRALHIQAKWDNPQDILDAVASQYRIDKWEDQPRHVEVWCEKDALKGVFTHICDPLQVGVFSTRGYGSQSEMWLAGRRLKTYIEAGIEPVILDFRDHDPSGIDMTRDVIERLEMFAEGRVEVVRLALNMNQIEEYDPPPNPAKIEDPRAGAYISEHGDYSWELDALNPETLAELVETNVALYRDEELWAAKQEDEDRAKVLLGKISGNWDEVSEYVEETYRDYEEDDDG